MNLHDFYHNVIVKAAEAISDHIPNTVQRRQFLTKIAFHESMKLEHIRQVFYDKNDNRLNGPALGFFQIEPIGHTGALQWLNRNGALLLLIRGYASQRAYEFDRDAELITNMMYSAMIANVIVFAAPEPLPSDNQHAAEYWGRWYRRKIEDQALEDFQLHAQMVDDLMGWG